MIQRSRGVAYASKESNDCNARVLTIPGVEGAKDVVVQGDRGVPGSSQCVTRICKWRCNGAAKADAWASSLCCEVSIQPRRCDGRGVQIQESHNVCPCRS